MGTRGTSPTDQYEISHLILSLKNDCASGADDIKPRPLKAICETISTPLAHVCNLMLATGVFPEKMRHARVAVIHKGGPVDDLYSCRPISVLSVFAKVYLKVL